MAQNQIGKTADKIRQDLKQQYCIVEEADIQKKINRELAEWETQSQRRLLVDNPFYDHKLVLDKALKDFDHGIHFLTDIENDLKNYSVFKQKINSPLDGFWGEQIQEIKAENSVDISKLQTKFSATPSDAKKTRLDLEKLKRNAKSNQYKLQGLRGALLKQGQAEIEQSYIEWELTKLEEFRREIFKKLTTWLDLLRQMFDFLNSLSLQPGLLLDLSPSELTAQDVQYLKKWADYISQNQSVKNLCDMMGRLRQVAQSYREKLVKTTTKIIVTVPDFNSKEEITSVILGRDIENAIPQEKALLADQDTAALFYLKYSEKRLLCFENQGFAEVEKNIDGTKKAQITENEKMGPIIICVDTSGSMHGSPENIAKSMTLYMTTRAKQQNRACYLINFSTTIETMDFSDGFGLKELLNFLKMSFHGGTDMCPALEESVRKIQKEQYKRADVLVISDFVMADLPMKIKKSIDVVKKNKNKFYSLCIGNDFARNANFLKSVFDRYWVYNPSSGGVDELINFIENQVNIN